MLVRLHWLYITPDDFFSVWMALRISLGWLKGSLWKIYNYVCARSADELGFFSPYILRLHNKCCEWSVGPIRMSFPCFRTPIFLGKTHGIWVGFKKTGLLPGCLVDSLAKGQQLASLLEQLRLIKPNSVTLAAALGACGLQRVEGEGYCYWLGWAWGMGNGVCWWYIMVWSCSYVKNHKFFTFR